MRKILAIAIVAVMTVALCVSANALVHTSADQIMAGSDGHDLAGFGGNDKDGTELGTITESSFFAWGWYSTECEQGITEFGYRYGDNVTLGTEKFIGGDADVIASQCGGVGESVRFKIEIPVVKGNDVEVFAVAKLGDGTVEDIWRIVYTSEQGAEAPAGEDPKAEDPPCGKEHAGNDDPHPEAGLFLTLRIVIGFPVRYIHSHYGIASLADFENGVKLAVEIIRRLDKKIIRAF